MNYLIKLLRYLRWIMLPITVIVFLQFVECATDGDGISVFEEEYMYWAWILLIANAALFIWNKKWQKIIEKVSDKVGVSQG